MRKKKQAPRKNKKHVNDVKAKGQTINMTTDESKTIVYTPYTIPNPDNFFPDNTVEAMKAGETGLCYVKCVDMYTVVHILTNHILALDWFVETEQLAQQWIEELVALADWRETVPQIRDVDSLILLACIGLLTED